VVATPAGRAAQWSATTSEQNQSVAALLEAGVEIVANVTLEAFDGRFAELACVFTGRRSTLACDSLVPLTRREPWDGLYHGLLADPDVLATHGIVAVRRIGDCEAPSLIAAAVYSGHAAAMALGEPEDGDAVLARRELPALD
jgi:dimethylamine/trimethylamine dehydrogenase